MYGMTHQWGKVVKTLLESSSVHLRRPLKEIEEISAWLLESILALHPLPSAPTLLIMVFSQGLESMKTLLIPPKAGIPQTTGVQTFSGQRTTCCGLETRQPGRSWCDGELAL